MPLDLGRLSRRRASAKPTPSEEFIKYSGRNERTSQEEETDIVESSIYTSSGVTHDGQGTNELQNSEGSHEDEGVYDYEDTGSSAYTEDSDNDNNNDNVTIDYASGAAAIDSIDYSSLGNHDYIDDNEDNSFDFGDPNNDDETGYGYDNPYPEASEDISKSDFNLSDYGDTDFEDDADVEHVSRRLDEPVRNSGNPIDLVRSDTRQLTTQDDRTRFTSVPSDGTCILTEDETKALLERPSSEDANQESSDSPDNTNLERKFMFTPTPLVEESKLNQSFSYTIETFAIEVMNASEITNVSLSSFGDISLIYEPDRLSLLKMGRHKFIGRPLSALDKQRLFYTLNEFIRKCEEDGKSSITIKLTQRVFYRGVPYTSLVATSAELSEYAGIFGSTVYFNPDEPDELNLVAVIKCRE